MLKRRFYTAFLAAALTSVASAQVVTPPAPVLVPPARDIAPLAPSPRAYLPAPAPEPAPTVVYSEDAVAEYESAADADAVSPDVPAYSDLCRAAPKPPWCEDKPASPRTP